MKKWMYLVFPGVMLALFLVFYFSHKKEADEKEAARIVAMEKKKAEEKKQKDVAEEKAKIAAAQRQAEREKEEADKERARREKTAAMDKQIADETNAALADGDKSQKEINALELELKRLHQEKDRLGREAFDVAKQVEMQRVEKRNAEMEIQRFTEMIARRAAGSAMAQMPPPPPAPPAR
jgi:hypothetical protein